MSVPVVESSTQKMEEGPQIFLVPKKRSFNFKKMRILYLVLVGRLIVEILIISS